MNKKIIREFIQSSFWDIGFVEENINDVISAKRLNIHWIKHNYKDRWFADPFILSVTSNEIVLFVEEYRYKQRKGRLAKLVLDRHSYVLKEMKIILELDSHLSFPMIFRKDDHIYVMPENSMSGNFKLYQYELDLDLLREIKTIAKLPLTDAVLFTIHKGKSYILSTKLPEPNSGCLYIYDFDMNDLNMNETPIQIIPFKKCDSRNAGNLFSVNNKLYRPAQDCDGSYGKGIYFQRVTITKDGVFNFETINYITPNDRRLDMGYHTINEKDGVVVIDGHGHRFKILFWIYKLYVNIKLRFV